MTKKIEDVLSELGDTALQVIDGNETFLKRSEGSYAAWRDPAYVEVHRRKMKEHHASGRMSVDKLIENNKTPEQRAFHSENMKRRWVEQREKMSAAQRIARTPEWKAKASVSAKKAWQDKETRESVLKQNAAKLQEKMVLKFSDIQEACEKALADPVPAIKRGNGTISKKYTAVKHGIDVKRFAAWLRYFHPLVFGKKLTETDRLLNEQDRPTE